MNTSTRLVLLCGGFLLANALRAEEPAKSAPASPPEDLTMIADFRSPLPGIFQYGTWDGKVALAKSGLAVLGSKGAQGNGGFGRDLGATMDFSAVTEVEVAVGVVPTNEVPQFTVAFNDADGTQYTARITIDQLVPSQPVWMRVHKADFKLNNVERGADGVMDWSKVTRWHLQGDWNTQKPFGVIFIALRVRR